MREKRRNGNCLTVGDPAIVEPPDGARKFVYTVAALGQLIAQDLQQRGALTTTDAINCQWQLDATGERDLYVDVYLYPRAQDT